MVGVDPPQSDRLKGRHILHSRRSSPPQDVFLSHPLRRTRSWLGENCLAPSSLGCRWALRGLYPFLGSEVHCFKLILIIAEISSQIIGQKNLRWYRLEKKLSSSPRKLVGLRPILWNVSIEKSMHRGAIEQLKMNPKASSSVFLSLGTLFWDYKG